MDKKDFFSTPKKGLKMTGASDDSLNNVGLMSSDPFFVDHNIAATESIFTNNSSRMSSSSVLSSSASKYSDSLWSSQPQHPAPVPRIQTEAWEAAPHYATTHRGQHRSNYSSSNTLRVALPPEDSTGATSPGLNTQTSNTYGSILELEASPRKFRKHEIPDFYSANQDALAFNYSSGRYGAEFDSLGSMDSSQSIPMPAEPPPALPQRPPKLSSVSPPPLPPKKQSVMSSSSVFSNQRYQTPPAPQHADSDIYDFIHENTGAISKTKSPSPAPPPLPCKENDIPLEDLVKMSVVELSQRMLEGKLPHHLTGMSLFELVEFISKQTREMEEAKAQAKSQDNIDKTSSEAEIKSSFSDNFVGRSSMRESTSNQSSQPLSMMSQSNKESHHSSIFSTSSLTLQTQEPIPKLSSTTPQQSTGFDDDFSRFTPSLSTVEKEEKTGDSEPFDKYAVFRELQMEEEISNALKSPTQENVDLNLEDEEEFQDTVEEPDETEVVNNENDLQLYKEEINEDENQITSDNIEQNLMGTDEINEQSEPIPEINIEDIEERNVAEDHSIVVAECSPVETFVEEEDVEPHKMSNGQAVMIEDAPCGEPLSTGAEESTFNENFNDSFTVEEEKETNEKNSWATFEDERSFEFNSFLSSEEQNRLLSKPQGNNAELESFEASWEPSFQQTRSQSTDPSRQTQFDPFSNRPGTEPPKEWSDAWNDNSSELINRQSVMDEAFPSSNSISHEKSPCSLKVSNDSIFNSPFTDNFVAFERAGAVSATPPLVSATPPHFEGDSPADRISNQSRQSAQSGEYVDTLDVFDDNNSFANSNFKIQAKTVSMTNSDSVDIFKVSADPFDDDFFK